jgi:hypothetical protein
MYSFYSFAVHSLINETIISQILNAALENLQEALAIPKDVPSVQVLQFGGLDA